MKSFFQLTTLKKTVTDIVELFDIVDIFMNEFILLIAEKKLIEYKVNEIKNTAAPFKLFSHVITHEFHHKGQILSVSRHLGYLPVDTDIMR